MDQLLLNQLSICRWSLDQLSFDQFPFNQLSCGQLLFGQLQFQDFRGPMFFCYEAAACCLLILPPSLANPRIHNSKKSFLVTKLFSPTPLLLSVSLSLTLSFSLSLSLSNFQPIFLILSRSHLILPHSLLPFMFFSISLLSNNNLFQPL